MADNAGTPAGESGNPGGTAPQAISVTIPDAWAADENFKGFFKEADGKKQFDLSALQASYLDTKKALPAVPKSADAYKFEFPQEWPFDETDQKLFKETAQKHGLTQAQYEAVVKHDLSRMVRAADEAGAEAKKAMDALQGEWKANFKGNLELAKKAADKIFGPEFSKRVDVGNDPAVIKGLYLIATKMGEDTFRQGGAPQVGRPTGVDGKPRLKFQSMGD